MKKILKLGKRVLCLTMVMLMMIACLPLSAFADKPNIVFINNSENSSGNGSGVVIKKDEPEEPKAQVADDTVDYVDYAPEAQSANVAKIGDTEYATLAAAIEAAQPGETIIFLADINESITTSKDISIDGAGHTYNGWMTFTSKQNLSVQNVNFAWNARLCKTSTGDKPEVIIKNCNFSGCSTNYYMVDINGTSKMVLENVTASNSSLGFVNAYNYDKLHVKDATVNNAFRDGVGFKMWGYASSESVFENVKINAPYIALYLERENAVTLKNVSIKSNRGIYARVAEGVPPTYKIEDCSFSETNIPFDFGSIAYRKTLVFSGLNLVPSIPTGSPVIAEAKNGTKIGSLVDILADAKPGDTVTLLQDYTGNEEITIPGDIIFDKNGCEIPENNAAQIGENKYATLADALAAAKAGDTITFLADITEEVTLDKDLTIDGANFKYTGTMDIGTATNVTIQNVNFVKGSINGSTLADQRNLTINSCTFDGKDKSILYAIRVKGGSSVVIENSSAVNYNYGMLYIAGVTATTVKNVTVGNAYLAFNISSSCESSFENVNLTSGVNRGLQVQLQNTAKPFTFTDCTFKCASPIVFSTGTGQVTFEFVGNNTMDALSKKEGMSFKLAAGATLVAPKDLTINTVEGYEVVYENDVYASVKKAAYVAMIGEQGYETLADALAAAQAGDTITFLADITEDITVSKKVTIDGADFTYTGAMTLEADTTIKNVNFDGKGYNGYAITTRGANYLTIEDCTAKNYGYGFVQLASATVLTTVKNVTISDMNYGVKVDYSGAVVIENANITAAVAAVLNSNYGEKTITIKNSKLNILGTWTRNNTKNTNYVFEGENTIGEFVIDTAIDNFKLVADATLTAPEGLTVTSANDDYMVKYVDGAYKSVKIVAKIDDVPYATIAEAIAAAKAGDTITFCADINENVTINKNLTIDGAEKNYTGTMTINNVTVTIENVNFVKGQVYKHKSTGSSANITIKNCAFDGRQELDAYAINLGGTASIVIENVTAKDYGYGLLQVPSSCVGLTVKDVTVSGCYYGLKVDYANAVTLENVKIEANVGIYDSNYGDKTYTIKNCTISSISIWERTAAKTTTFKFEGANTVGTLSTSQYAKYELGAADATLTAPADFTITTKVKSGKIIYEDGIYSVFVGLLGSGTENDPYQIGSVEDLIFFRDSVNAGETKYNASGVYVALTADIDMAAATWERGIGDGINATFDGIFDGKNFAIKNLNFAPKADSDGYLCGGLFGYTYGAAVIKNLVLDKITVTTTDAGHNVGILVGFAYNKGGKLTVSNVTVKNVEIDAPNAYGVGAIVGYSYLDMGTIENCTVDDANITGYSFVGGITGYSYTNAIITGCTVNNATITATSKGAGGIAGLALNAKITGNTVKDTTVTAPKNCGSVVGELGASNAEISNNTAAEPQLGGDYKTGEPYQAKIGNKYYTSIADAIAAAQAGETVTILAGTYAMPSMKAGITIEGVGNVMFEGTLSGTLENLTLKNIHIKGGNAQRWAYAKGNLVFENVTFEATSVYALHFDGITAGATLTYKNCTIIGWAAMSGSPASCVFDGCTFKGNGTYGVIRTYFDATIKDCTFDVANVNTTDNYQDGIHAVSGATVTVDNCTNVNGDMKDIVNVSGASVVELDDKTIQNVAKIGDTYYATLQAAIAAATDGQTITLVQNINLADEQTVLLDGKYNTYFKVEGKSITIDLNDKTISGEYNGSTMLVGVFSTENDGHLTLTGNGKVDVTATGIVYSLIANYEPGCSITIENGTYILDEAKDSLIYSGSDAGVIVNGGTFNLGNVGTGANQSPWIFNALGQNANKIVVTGGTYNFNVAKQYYAHEVGIVDANGNLSYIIDNGDGTWTVTGKTAEAGIVTPTFRSNYLYGYATLADAIAAAKAGDTIELLADIEANEVILIGKSLTINGNGHKVTSSATRVFRVTTSDVEVTLNGVNMVSTKASSYIADIRGISIDASLTNVKLTLNDCSVDFTDASACDWAYAVNVSGNGTGHTVTVNGGSYEGANVINAHGANNTIIVKNATLTSLYANNDLYYGACIWVLQNQGSSVEATGNTFNGANAVAFNVGTGTEVTESDNTDNTTSVVAKIGNTYYTSLADAFAAAKDGDTIKLLQNIELNAAITNTKKITLDLNGKTITGTDNATGSFGLITNKGELTITGNGTITLEATNNRGWNAYSSVISNTVGGKLIVENGTIEHLGGTDMAYAIDNLTNGKGTYAETVINGGTIKSTYRAIRQFLNGVEAQNILTINGGTIEGENKAIFFHDPSKNANTGKLTVDANAVINGDIYLFVTAGSTEWPVEVSIAASAVNGEVLTANVPAKYAVQKINGVWTADIVVAYVNGVGYATFAEALEAAKAGDTITFFADITEDVTVSKKVTIDGANYTYTGKMLLKADTTIKNVNFDGKGYNGYAIETRGANYLTIENCTAKNYGYGFVQTASGTVLTTVKNVTVSNMNYGIKVDYSNAVVLENVDITANVAAVLNSNYGEKTITIKNSELNILGTWTRNNTIKTTYVFEGENTVGEFKTDAAIDTFKLADKNSTLTTSGTIDVTTDLENCTVKYEDGKYIVKINPVAKIGNVMYDTLAEAVANAKPGATIVLLRDAEGAGVVIDKNITINFNGKTYSVTTPVGSKGTESNGFQILVGNTVIFRDGTLKVADSAADKFYILIQNYSNLTVNGMTLDGTNLDKYAFADGDSYVLSNNSGKVTINSKTQIIVNNDGDKAWAIDACKFGNYAEPTVTVGSNVPAKYIEAAAKIGNTYYATLQQAINVATDKATISLYRDVAGPGVVINKNITINFGGKTYSVTTPVGSKGTESNGFQILVGNTVTLRNGTLKVADSAADEFYILVQNYANLTISGMTLDGTNLDKYAFTDGDSYTLSNNSGTVTVNGKSKIIANNDGEKAFAFDVCKYGNYELPTVYVDATCTIDGNIEAAAKVDKYYYATFEAAYEAVKAGQTVVLYKDMILTKDDVVKTEDGLNVMFLFNKNVTLDLNGHTIYVDYDSAELLYAVIYVADGTSLIVNDSVGNGGIELKTGDTLAGKYDCVAYMFWKRGTTGRLNINAGNYHANKLEDSMVYTNSHLKVTVAGGSFILDNVGNGTNGAPWIFNTKGQNENKITVTGGTFNADVFHQYWVFEVTAAKDLALQYNEETGLWTVVEAVAYVNEQYFSSGKWYTKNVGYATIDEAQAAANGKQTATLSGKTYTSAEEKVTELY